MGTKKRRKKGSGRGEFKKEWFQARLADRNLSQRGFARAVKVDPAGMSLIMNGDRLLQLDEALAFAKVLRLSLSEVLHFAGLDVHAEQRVPIRGVVDDLCNVHELKSAPLMVAAPSDMPPDGYAVQVRVKPGSRYKPFDRWLIFVAGLKQAPAEAIGQFVLCGLENSQQCLALVGFGYEHGTFNLSLGDIEHVNQHVSWTQRVMWVRPSTNHEEGH